MEVIRPAELHLGEDELRTAINLFPFINSEIRKSFNKTTMKARVKLNYDPSGPIKLFIKEVLEEFHWAVEFTYEGGHTYVNVTAKITLSEEREFLNQK